MYGKEKPVRSWDLLFPALSAIVASTVWAKAALSDIHSTILLSGIIQLQDQSNVDIQALCDCTVYVINHSQLADFYDINNDHQKLGRRIAETLLWEIYDRMISMYSLTPEERYLDIINRCPDLLKLITLKELASYLLIRPETLSRIRRKVVRK